MIEDFKYVSVILLPYFYIRAMHTFQLVPCSSNECLTKVNQLLFTFLENIFLCRNNSTNLPEIMKEFK